MEFVFHHHRKQFYMSESSPENVSEKRSERHNARFLIVGDSRSRQVATRISLILDGYNTWTFKENRYN